MAADDGGPEHEFRRRVAGKARRRRRRETEEDERTPWFWLGMFGLVGWAVAVPTLAGVALGIWLDRQWPAGPSFTLNLLIIGVIIGCLNAWYWVRQELRDDSRR